MQFRWKYLFFILALFAGVVWFGILVYPDKNLHLIACDVGQGDAILVVFGSTQILVDGGPDNKVLDCLGAHIPFWDREIETIVLTHPQKDHAQGLIEVIKRYRVENFIATPLDSSTEFYRVLKGLVGRGGVRVVNPVGSTSIRLGLMYLDILWPAESLLDPFENFSVTSQGSGVLGTFTSKRDPNDFSVVALLRYKEFDALLTGDIGPTISDTIADELALGGKRSIEYLKVPHHGSKNGLSKKLLEVVAPEVAVISVGKNNRYGHPSKEIIEMLGDMSAGRKIKILRTDEIGDVEVISDGQKWWVK